MQTKHSKTHIERDTGGPAFPIGAQNDCGTTLRDYFAANAMQGILAGLAPSLCAPNWLENVAQSSYKLADAMLKVRDA